MARLNNSKKGLALLLPFPQVRDTLEDVVPVYGCLYSFVRSSDASGCHIIRSEF